MTPAEFPEHFRRMLWGLNRLTIKLPDNRTILDARDAVARNLGEDWVAVFVEHKNTGALIYRMRKLDTPVAQQLYRYVALAVQYGQDILRAEADYNLAIAQAEANFWGNAAEVLQLPGRAFEQLVKGVAGGAGVVLGGLLEGLKPLLLPAALVIGAILVMSSLGKKSQ